MNYNNNLASGYTIAEEKQLIDSGFFGNEYEYFHRDTQEKIDTGTEKEICDWRLQAYFQAKLNQDPYYNNDIKNLRTCKKIVLRPLTDTVYVFANNKEGFIWGVNNCHSPWACPTCSAKVMAKEASKIAMAINALKKQHKSAFMVTLSIPHFHDMSCKTVFTALRETWKKFRSNWTQKDTSQKNTPSIRFKNKFNIKYYVSVTEFTFGHYGWHPHLHILMWVDNKDLQKVGDYQKELSDYWRKCTRTILKKVLKKDNYLNDPDKVDSLVDIYFDNPNEDQKKRMGTEFYISRTSEGKVRKCQTSDYICGWGADKEVTGNIRKKASHHNHYTPHELLQMAYKLDNNGKTTTNPKADKLFQHYLEYARATFGKYRTKYTVPLNEVIAAWKKTQEYIEECRKKKEQIQKEIGVNRLVTWFTREQWQEIYYLKLIPDILELAPKPNGRQLIEQLLLDYLIDITRNDYPPEWDFHKKFMPTVHMVDESTGELCA